MTPSTWKLILAAAVVMLTLPVLAKNLSLASAPLACIPVESLGLCANVEFALPPKENVNSPFVLTFTKLHSPANRVGESILPTKNFKVDLFMPDMKHGSSPITITRFPISAIYYVDQVFFLMAGDWVVRIIVPEQNGEAGQLVSIPVQIHPGQGQPN